MVRAVDTSAADRRAVPRRPRRPARSDPRRPGARAATGASPTCACSASTDRSPLTRPALVFGDDKYELLASSAAAAQPPPRPVDAPADGTAPAAYFEWARMVEAMANGCVVVTEPSEGYEPLRARRPLRRGRRSSELGGVLDELLPTTTAATRSPMQRAQAAVTGQLALRRLRSPRCSSTSRRRAPAASPSTSRRADRRGGCGASAPSEFTPPVRLGRVPPVPRPAAAREAARARREQRAAPRSTRRRACSRHGAPQHVERVETPAYADADPDVSRRRHAVRLRRRGRPRRSTASSPARTSRSRWSSSRTTPPTTAGRSSGRSSPSTPTCRWCCSARTPTRASPRRGTPASQRARAPLVMVIDADNHLYPTCLRGSPTPSPTDPRPSGARTRSSRTSATSANMRSALGMGRATGCAAPTTSTRRR